MLICGGTSCPMGPEILMIDEKPVAETVSDDGSFGRINKNLLRMNDSNFIGIARHPLTTC